MRVLIVEDEPDIAEGIATALRREGYKPEIATDGITGEKLAAFNNYGLILLDVMLPGRDGREVCANLRRAGVATPVLMITARDQISDKVRGLDSGADDYLVKPFAVEELFARIRALTRRESSQKAGVLQSGPLEIDTLNHIVRKDGAPIHLTQREFALLEALARNEGRVLSRDAILERVFHSDEALPNTVNFHMSSLRKKIDPDGTLIRTVHGFGYSMRPGDD